MGLKRFVIACLFFAVSVCVAPSAASALKFDPAPTSPLTGPIYAGETVSGDLNDDGFDDLVVGASGDGASGAGVYVWLGDSAGNFSAAPGSPLFSGTGVPKVELGQLNPDTDSDLDLVAFDGGSTFTMLFGDGDGTFTNGGTTDMGISPYGAELGDLNDDGVLDLAVVGYPNRISVAMNDGEGAFAVSPQQTVTGATELDSLAIGDYDGDGDGDLAMSNFSLSPITNWAVFAAKGNGDGTFTDVPGNPFQMASGNIARSVVTVDLNGDAADDLAISTQPGNDPSENQIQTMLGDENSFLVQNPGQTARSDDTPFYIFGGDIDGDGFDDDAATANFGGGNVSVGLGDHEGGFALAPGSPFSVGIPGPGLRYFPQDGTVGDFNGDGAPDIALGSSAGGSGVVMGVSVLLAQPDLRATAEQIEFGAREIGSGVDEEDLAIRNDGTVTAGIDSATIAGPDADQFDVAEPAVECGTLAYEEDCDLVVGFDPSSVGSKNATLLIGTTESEDPIAISLTGSGTPEPVATMDLSPKSIEFPETTVGDSSSFRGLTVASTGDLPLQIVDVKLSGSDTGAFTVLPHDCETGPFESGDSCVIDVAFNPGSAGAKAAVLEITGNAPAASVQLSGVGASATPPPPDPPVLTTSAKLSLKAPKKVKRDKKLKVTASVRNTGTAALTNVVLAAKVPGKLAKAPKKLKIASIPVGQTVKKTITVAVKKKAKRGRKLTVNVSATAGGTKLSSAKVAARVK